MMSSKNEFRNLLDKCSKKELIQAILTASEFPVVPCPWGRIIADIKLNKIETKINVTLEEGERLVKQLQSIPPQERTYNNGEYTDILIKINENDRQWDKLNKQYERIFNEIYSK